MIQVFDDVFTSQENERLYNEILYRNKFAYGEVDRAGTPPTGLVFELTDRHLYDKFYQALLSKYDEIGSLEKQRAYVNLFTPGERPYYHTDGNVVTCLFYLNPVIDADDCGETIFKLDTGEVVAVEAKPSRLAIFDGMILHRATSFRNKPRITVALKFYKS